MVNYWKESSNNDAQTMKHLFDHGDYSWALFLGHISLEKALKAAYVQKNADHPPRIHDLVRILERTGIQCDTDMLNLLDTVTTFNIRARYDDFRKEFATRCTKDYSLMMIERIEEARLWILQQL